jgi:ribose-phosphate pyrophosphokinase
VCAGLRADLAALEERTFEDGEFKIRSLVNVRNRDVCVLHSLASDAEQTPNDKLCRLLFLIGALKDAAAARVTAVAPYLCYARKDRQTKPRDPVTTRYVAQLFEAVGTDRLVTMEVHNLAAFQNAFRCDTEHLDANAVFAAHFKRAIGDRPAAVVSPDPGGVKRAEVLRARLERILGRPVGGGFMEKHRSQGRVSGTLFAGEVSGKSVIVVDDLISTGGTMARAAAACVERGAERVFLAATHALFNERATEVLGEAKVEQIVVTDTVGLPQPVLDGLKGRLVILGVTDIFAEAIRRCQSGESIVALLGDDRPDAE